MSVRLESLAARVELGRIIERITPLAVLGDPAGVVVRDVAFHSADVLPGSLFCCLAGAVADGHDYAGAAVANGAVAVLCEHSLGTAAREAVQLVVAPGAARHAMALASCALYGDPAASLRTVGVTGTNGKTTTTYLLRSILERHGWQTGVVGTLDGARTTPESPELQRALARQRDAGCAASALEVTSHALAQHRVDGIRFDVAVFTNLSQDHLDYHETMEAYFGAKAALFSDEHAAAGVVNLDDAYGRRLLDRCAIPCTGYSLDEAVDLDLSAEGATFFWEGLPVRLGLGGAFNVENALAAAAAARTLGVSSETIVAGLEDARAVPGRFERLASSDGLTVVVDYAHTPAALEKVLLAARRAGVPQGGIDTSGRLFAVFGCGGDRDRGKRPAMGAIAASLADVVVLTSDNPRSENPASIIDEVRAGVDTPNGNRVADCVVEVDRRLAIEWAVAEARPGDVIVVAGKGHETTQQFADRTIRFDDREVVLEAMARVGHAPSGASRTQSPQRDRQASDEEDRP